MLPLASGFTEVAPVRLAAFATRGALGCRRRGIFAHLCCSISCLQTVTVLAGYETVNLPMGAETMEKFETFEQAPTAVNVTVRNRRPREYLTEREIERLMKAAGQNRWGHRDATAILIAYRHGLRASELVAVRWDDIELATGRLHIRRGKGGAASVHPIGARESRALRKMQREAKTPSPYVFVSERGAPLSVAGYQRMVARAGEAAGFAFLIHSHMLRHSCGSARQ